MEGIHNILSNNDSVFDELDEELSDMFINLTMTRLVRNKTADSDSLEEFEHKINTPAKNETLVKAIRLAFVQLSNKSPSTIRALIQAAPHYSLLCDGGYLTENLSVDKIIKVEYDTKYTIIVIS